MCCNGSEDEAKAVGEDSLNNNQDRQPDDAETDTMVSGERDEEEEQTHDSESDQATDDLVEDEQGVREGDFFYEIAVSEECGGGAHDGFVENDPREEASADVEAESVGVVDVFHAEAIGEAGTDDAREEDGEDEDLSCGLEDVPEDTDDGPSVAGTEVLDDKVPEEAAIAPDIREGFHEMRRTYGL